MGCKYLGDHFDIHGGGMDLLFPHHESEIAQSTIANGKAPVKYWMHNNMITINGQKMGKSLGNAMSLDDIFTGYHPMLEKAYSPMTIRFFILMAHYRSTLDFSNEALQAAEKGLRKLMAAADAIKTIHPDDAAPSQSVDAIGQACYTAMADDFNSPMVIAQLFDAVRIVNGAKDQLHGIRRDELEKLASLFQVFVFDILGLRSEESNGEPDLVEGLVQTIIGLRQDARQRKDYGTSDKIRNELGELGIELKDGRDGTSWQRK